MLAQLELALLREWQQFQPEFPVRAILESYLTTLISEKRCARLRGKGSDGETIDLWYDPREQIFLLKNSYFSELKQLFVEVQEFTKRNWELLMEKAGFIETVQRKNKFAALLKFKRQGENQENIRSKDPCQNVIQKIF